MAPLPQLTGDRGRGSARPADRAGPDPTQRPARPADRSADRLPSSPRSLASTRWVITPLRSDHFVNTVDGNRSNHSARSWSRPSRRTISSTKLPPSSAARALRQSRAPLRDRGRQARQPGGAFAASRTLGGLATRKPACERPQHESRLGRKGHVSDDTDEDAERYAQHCSERDGGSVPTSASLRRVGPINERPRPCRAAERRAVGRAPGAAGA
jgi:hypothetical protein